MEFADKLGSTRVKIHPPDRVTSFSHMHIYDKIGRSLDLRLGLASRRSPEAHIKIKPLNDLDLKRELGR